MSIKKGDRVRVTGFTDDPVPMEIGAEGTVVYASEWQIDVEWDNGRGLMLLPEDPFIVIGRQ